MSSRERRVLRRNGRNLVDGVVREARFCNRTCHARSRIVLNMTLTAGGASVASHGAMLPAAWSCGMEGARSASAAFSARSASGSGYRQRRSSVIRRSRKKGFAERSRVKRSVTKAQASRPWVHAAFAATNAAARAGANQYASGNTLNLLPQQPPKCRLTAPGMRARCSAGSGKGLPPASKLFPPCADI